MRSFSGRLPADLDDSIVDRMPSPASQQSDAPLLSAPVNLSDASASAAQLRVRLPSGMLLRRALEAPYTPMACGSWELRRAIADWLTTQHRPTSAYDILAASSTSEAFSWLLKWWCAPGDAVGHMVPGYPLLAHLAEAEGVRPLPIGCEWNGQQWQLRLDEVEAALARGARAIVLTSPNNPTGARLSEAQAHAVADLCNAHEALCIVDEVFGPYVLRAAWPQQPLAHAERVVSLGGLSKAALLPQAKLSWLHLSGTPAFRRDARIHLTWLGDLYLSVSAVAAQVAISVLPHAARLQERVRMRLRGNLRWLRWALPREGVGEVVPVDGGFVAPVQFSDQVRAAQGIGPGGHGLASWTARAGVTLEPASLYDLPEPWHAVASLLLPPARMKAGWQRLFDAA